MYDKVRRESCEIIQEKSQSVEFVAKSFTVLAFCGLSMHMIIHTPEVEGRELK